MNDQFKNQPRKGAGIRSRSHTAKELTTMLQQLHLSVQLMPLNNTNLKIKNLPVLASTSEEESDSMNSVETTSEEDEAFCDLEEDEDFGFDTVDLCSKKSKSTKSKRKQTKSSQLNDSFTTGKLYPKSLRRSRSLGSLLNLNSNRGRQELFCDELDSLDDDLRINKLNGRNTSSLRSLLPRVKERFSISLKDNLNNLTKLTNLRDNYKSNQQFRLTNYFKNEDNRECNKSIEFRETNSTIESKVSKDNKGLDLERNLINLTNKKSLKGEESSIGKRGWKFESLKSLESLEKLKSDRFDELSIANERSIEQAITATKHSNNSNLNKATNQPSSSLLVVEDYKEDDDEENENENEEMSLSSDLDEELVKLNELNDIDIATTQTSTDNNYRNEFNEFSKFNKFRDLNDDHIHLDKERKVNTTNEVENERETKLKEKIANVQSNRGSAVECAEEYTSTNLAVTGGAPSELNEQTSEDINKVKVVNYKSSVSICDSSVEDYSTPSTSNTSGLFNHHSNAYECDFNIQQNLIVDDFKFKSKLEQLNLSVFELSSKDRSNCVDRSYSSLSSVNHSDIHSTNHFDNHIDNHSINHSPFAFYTCLSTSTLPYDKQTNKKKTSKFLCLDSESIDQQSNKLNKLDQSNATSEVNLDVIKHSYNQPNASFSNLKSLEKNLQNFNQKSDNQHTELNTELNTEFHTENQTQFNTELNTELDSQLHTELNLRDVLLNFNLKPTFKRSIKKHRISQLKTDLPVVLEENLSKASNMQTLAETQYNQLSYHLAALSCVCDNKSLSANYSSFNQTSNSNQPSSVDSSPNSSQYSSPYNLSPPSSPSSISSYSSAEEDCSILSSCKNDLKLNSALNNQNSLADLLTVDHSNEISSSLNNLSEQKNEANVVVTNVDERCIDVVDCATATAFPSKQDQVLLTTAAINKLNDLNNNQNKAKDEDGSQLDNELKDNHLKTQTNVNQNNQNKPVRVRKTSILRNQAPDLSSCTNYYKKEVKFADTLGFALEKIKYFPPASPQVKPKRHSVNLASLRRDYYDEHQELFILHSRPQTKDSLAKQFEERSELFSKQQAKLNLNTNIFNGNQQTRPFSNQTSNATNNFWASYSAYQQFNPIRGDEYCGDMFHQPYDQQASTLSTNQPKSQTDSTFVNNTQSTKTSQSINLNQNYSSLNYKSNSLEFNGLNFLNSQSFNSTNNSNQVVSFLPLNFGQPYIQSDFPNRLRSQSVLLHSLDVVGNIIHGIISVMNLTFEKKITVKYTLNKWVTEKQCEARYSKKDCDNSDKFIFQINLKEQDFPQFQLDDDRTMMFAVRYETGDGDVYWDNNFGQDYRLKCKFN